MSNFYSFYPPSGGGSSNPSVGSNGGIAPTSSTEIGFIDNSGNLQGVSATNPLPVTIDGGLANPLNVNLADVAGNATATGTGASNSGTQRVAVSSDSSLASIGSILNPLPSGGNNIGNVNPSNYQTGTIAALNQSIEAQGPVYDTVGVKITGTWVGTLTFQKSLDFGATWDPANLITLNGGIEGSTTTNVVGTVSIAGYYGFQVIATAWTSGTATVELLVTDGIGSVSLNTPLPPGTNTIGAVTVSGGITPAADIAPATQNITIVDSGSTTTAQANGQNAITGTPTAGSVATFSISSIQSVEVQVTGTWTGTLESEMSFDNGVTWFTRGIKQSGASYLSSSFTANFQGGANITGATNYRVRAIATMTGTAIVKIIESLNESAIVVSNPLTLRDATVQSITNTIKAASTATSVTDTALVVGLSPNSPLPAGTNALGSVTVSGTVPLPTGAATAANQTNGTQKTQIVDGAGDVAGNFVNISGVNYIPVIQASSGPVAPGTAAARSTLTGLTYNTGGGDGNSGVTLTNGQQASLQGDQFGSLQTVGPDWIITGAAAQTAIVSNIITNPSGSAASNVNNYKSASVQVVSTGTGGTFIFEGSNDDVNFQSIPVYNQLILTGTAITGAITASATALIYTFPIHFNYIRLRIVTAITGGSIQAFTRFSQHAWTPASFQVSQNTSTNLNVAAAIAGNANTIASTFGLLVADVASAAITTTTTSSTFTPGFGVAYTVNIPVTAISGGGNMSVAVQESSDTSTNWYTVYTFPNITATGSYNSPMTMCTGNRVRYVQTLTGITSITRAINRIESNTSAEQVYKNLIDTSIVPSTTNSTTASCFVENTNTYTAIVNQGAGGSAVNFALDGSDDNQNWVLGIATCTGVVGGTSPVTMFYNGANFRWIRARVVTGVASATIVNISLIGSQGSNNPASSAGMIVTQATATNLNAQVVGDSASGATDSGSNPVKIGGVYNSTLPTFTNGQRGNVQLSSKGSVLVAGAAAVGFAPADNPITVAGVDGAGNKQYLKLDTGTNALLVDTSGVTLPSSPLTGQKTSTGTAVAVSSTSQPLTTGVIVQALSTNAGLVYVGGSSVSASTGFQLQPGQATSAAINNLNELYVISVSSGDGICFIGT